MPIDLPDVLKRYLHSVVSPKCTEKCRLWLPLPKVPQTLNRYLRCVDFGGSLEEFLRMCLLCKLNQRIKFTTCSTGVSWLKETQPSMRLSLGQSFGSSKEKLTVKADDIELIPDVDIFSLEKRYVF
ncbi:hypothetical protein F2Q69_00038518 [Brassica cretica]|uniref:Uncharacterized protein n=1 Tax=Brassica cretica TaxID=69181 RepID=A0A8S9SII0_BRACR|nr:hypothetical protein F2Q69_00038518 [Brassica cretica]